MSAPAPYTCPMTRRFTDRQGQFLAFIHRYTERRGYAPSFDDLAAHFGITSPSVNGMIKTLERNGLISRVPGAARTLRLEVAPELLPDIDFGRSRVRTGTGAPVLTPAGPSASTVAVATATAVLDSVLPELVRAGVGAGVEHVVFEAAASVKDALERAGVAAEESTAVARRIAAEAARWHPGGRGVVVPRRERRR